jgi:hypothetical protein
MMLILALLLNSFFNNKVPKRTNEKIVDFDTLVLNKLIFRLLNTKINKVSNKVSKSTPLFGDV